MNINGTIICTPYDTYPEYDPDWRNRVAKALAGSKDPSVLPETIKNDPWIASHRDFYCNNAADAVKAEDHWMHAMVQGWHDSSVINTVKLCLEPMLLTEVSFDILASDLLGTRYGVDGTKLIQLYERLFYDCRSDNGNIDDGAHRRRWLAFPADLRLGPSTPVNYQFKIAAYQGGYPGLMLAMVLTGCHGPKPTLEFQMEMMNLAMNSLLFRRSTTETIGNMDLIMAQRNLIEFYKAQKEDDTSDQRVNQVYATLMFVLKRFMPEVYNEEIPAEHKEMLDTAYTNKLKSQHQIEAHIAGVNDSDYQPSLGRLEEQTLKGIKQAVDNLGNNQAGAAK